MRISKPLNTVMAALLAGAMCLAVAEPATASNHSAFGEGGDRMGAEPPQRHWRGHRYNGWEGRNYYRGYRADRYRPYNRYSGNRYHGYRDYGYRERSYDPGAAAAAGIIGLTTGAIIGGALSHQNRAVPCYRFRSYDARSGTYVGRDGRRHYC